MLDPTKPGLKHREEKDDRDEDFIPAPVQNKCAGIPRSVRSLEKFYNPNPQDESEKQQLW
jgi:hypothetical protein